MSQWYYADRNRQRLGPVEAAELAALFHRNEVGSDTLVWRPGLEQWQALDDFAGELGLLEPVAVAEVPLAATTAAEAQPEAFRVVEDQPEAPAAESKAVFTAREPEYALPERTPAEPDSPYAPPRATISAGPAVVHGGEVVYAGFWKRVAAYIVDSLIVGIAGAVIGGGVGAILGGGFDIGNSLAFQGMFNVIGIILGVSYYAWFHASGNQATPGKMAVGIKVARSDGKPISFMRGIGRYFALIPSGLILGIGFLMAAFTERKRSLHDMICDTVVVDKWAFTDEPHRQRHELGTVTWLILVLGGLMMLALFAGAMALGAMFASAN